MTKEEFEQLTQVFRPRLVKSAVNRWGSEGEDVIQEAFLRAYIYLETWNNTSSFQTWIFGYARLVWKEMQRSDKLEYAEMDVFSLPEEDDMEEIIAVRQWMDSLTQSEKRAIMGEQSGNAERCGKRRAKRKWESDL